jgi:hypothetical protein
MTDFLRSAQDGSEGKQNIDCLRSDQGSNERNQMIDFLRGDRGSVESAFTLIPLLLLFLAVSQVCILVYSRDVGNEMTQGSVAFAAMGASQNQLSLGNSTWSSAPIAMPLPGGGSILVGERKVNVPGFSPFLPGGDSFLSTGVAVQE